MTPPDAPHGCECAPGQKCPTCTEYSLTEEEIARRGAAVAYALGKQEREEAAIAAQDQAPHVCNYASRYRPTFCRRIVTDGERYCSQHR
jgi:hypothetical protein